MTDVCPAILAKNSREYLLQLSQILSFARRVHVDLADGRLAPSQLLDISEVWWPANITVDLHVMYKWPYAHTGEFVALKPQMVITHAEAEGDFTRHADALHQHGIEVGVALMPSTPVDFISKAIDKIDHVLIFSGNFGHFGGQADLSLLGKATSLRQLKPSIEIGWDGGVTDQNARQIVEAGVDVLNAGSFIQRASDPQAAYARLKESII